VDTNHNKLVGSVGLPRVEVTSDLWCWEAPLGGCAPCPGPFPGSSGRTWSAWLATVSQACGSRMWRRTSGSRSRVCRTAAMTGLPGIPIPRLPVKRPGRKGLAAYRPQPGSKAEQLLTAAAEARRRLRDALDDGDGSW